MAASRNAHRRSVQITDSRQLSSSISGNTIREAFNSVLPKSLESIRREVRVAHGVSDVLVPEIVLQGSGVVTLIGELKAAGMTQHVGVHWECDLCRQRRARHKFTHIARRHRAATLRDEQVRAGRASHGGAAAGREVPGRAAGESRAPPSSGGGPRGAPP